MLKEPASRHFSKAELSDFITASYLFAAHLAALKVLLQRRTHEIDATRASQMMLETCKIVGDDLAQAIGILARPPDSVPGIVERQIPREGSDMPSADWGVEASLGRRLRSVIGDARTIRKLSTAIASN